MFSGKFLINIAKMTADFFLNGLTGTKYMSSGQCFIRSSKDELRKLFGWYKLDKFENKENVEI